MINQLDACQMEEDKVFHIHMELLDDDTDNFIIKSTNPSIWEIPKLEKRSTVRQLEI